MTDTSDYCYLIQDEKENQEIIKEQLEKFKNFDYEEFLRRSQNGFKRLKIDEKTGRKYLNAFMERAKAYKEKLLPFLQDKLIPSYKNYKLPKEIYEAAKNDLEKFNSFMKNHNNFATIEDLKSTAKAYESRKENIPKPQRANECCIKRFFKNLWKKLKGFFFGTRFANNNEAAKNLRSGNFYGNQR